MARTPTPSASDVGPGLEGNGGFDGGFPEPSESFDDSPSRGNRSRDQVDPRFMSEREASDREYSEDREISDDQRLELLREALVQSVLPDLPTIPGYHVCWLTTTNARDSLQWRRRLGYKLVRVEEMGGKWDGLVVKGGDFAGCIQVNEMVAAMISLRLYNAYIREVHERQPLLEEQKLRGQIAQMADTAQSIGSYMQQGEGTAAALVQKANPMPELRE